MVDIDVCNLFVAAFAFTDSSNSTPDDDADKELHRIAAVFKTYQVQKSTATMAVICTHHGTSAPTLKLHSLASHRRLKNYKAKQ
eukprot:8307493-Ditylum_brightwellii.AAC.1